MKNYNIHFIQQQKIVITGKGDDSLWHLADELNDFVSPWDTQIPEKIEFRALWNFETLFFCFKVSDPTIHIDNKDNSVNSIGNSDRVELFFKTKNANNPYYCLEIDPTPRIMDFKAYPNKKFDFDWNWSTKDLKVKSHVDTKGFTVEIEISIASFQKLNLIKDNKIETGIFRAKYNKQVNANFEPTWISWVNPNTKNPNFHTPSSFGVLNLMGHEL